MAPLQPPNFQFQFFFLQGWALAFQFLVWVHLSVFLRLQQTIFILKCSKVDHPKQFASFLFFRYIIFGSKHMWWLFSICGSYVMQIVRHLVVYWCWARKQNMSVFFGVGVGCLKVGSTTCWIVFLMWGGGVHTSMMHGQDLHGWSLIPPKSFFWLSFKTCGLKILDRMDIGILGMFLTIYVSPKIRHSTTMITKTHVFTILR
jgi:hypothetical protein